MTGLSFLGLTLIINLYRCFVIILKWLSVGTHVTDSNIRSRLMQLTILILIYSGNMNTLKINPVRSYAAFEDGGKIR